MNKAAILQYGGYSGNFKPNLLLLLVLCKQSAILNFELITIWRSSALFKLFECYNVIRHSKELSRAVRFETYN